MTRLTGKPSGEGDGLEEILYVICIVVVLGAGYLAYRIFQWL